jgi:hypothetical protein
LLRGEKCGLKEFVVGQTLRSIVIVLLLVEVTTGCYLLGTSREERALIDDAILVTPLLPRSADGAFFVSIGAYKGGTAVIGDLHTAFWVKDGVPYTVTEAARSVAPDMAQAPESIQYNEEFIAATEAE